jgi:hypothetical protein
MPPISILIFVFLHLVAANFPLDSGVCTTNVVTGSFWVSDLSGTVGLQSNTPRSCAKCPAGTYMPWPAAHSDGRSFPYPADNVPWWDFRHPTMIRFPCVKCPPGTASQVKGATDSSVCLLCPSGFFSKEGAMACSPCPPGSWSEANSSSCVTVSTAPSPPSSAPPSAFTNCSMRDFTSSEVVGDVLGASIDVSSAASCKSACCNNTECLGFSFFKPLVSFPRCTLLAGNITYVVPTNHFDSAVRSHVLGY